MATKKKLEVTLKAEEEMREVDEHRVKATFLKAIEDFQTFVEFLVEKAIITS